MVLILIICADAAATVFSAHIQCAIHFTDAVRAATDLQTKSTRNINVYTKYMSKIYNKFSSQRLR